MKNQDALIKLSLLIVLAVFVFVPKSVLADGMMMRPDPYSDRWDYSNEINQQAFINYDNGLQKMIVSVGLGDQNSAGVVWLFPVPADPSRVAIDVVKSLPHLSGEEISGKAKSNLGDTTRALQMTQIYPLPLLFVSGGIVQSTVKGIEDSLGTTGTFNRTTESDVVVYEHIEKEGVASEIITAQTATGLYVYLKGKGLKIESGTIPVLDNYIGQDYSFIASWISPATTLSREEIHDRLLSSDSAYLESYLYLDLFADFRNLLVQIKAKYPSDSLDTCLNRTSTKNYCWIEYLRSRTDVLNILVEDIYNKPSLIYNPNLNTQTGVFVTFPSKDIYFPLLPTSVYGSKTVPATIRILGHVTPQVFPDIKSYTTTKYYVDSYANFADDLNNFYSGTNENIKYTKIEIDAPSKFLTADLRISPQAPIKTYYTTFVAKHSVVCAIILFILSSIISGIIAGLIIFKDLRKKPVRLGLLGLSNVLTLYGLLITTVLIDTKTRTPGSDSWLTDIKQKGYYHKRRIAAVLFYVAIPLLLFGLCVLTLAISPFSYSSLSDLVAPILIIYILPIAALIIGSRIKTIKAEDRNLFDQLKLAGYSAWSFQPKDGQKIAFVPIFSVCFMLLSWLLVSLVRYTT